MIRDEIPSSIASDSAAMPDEPERTIKQKLKVPFWSYHASRGQALVLDRVVQPLCRGRIVDR